MEPPCKRTKNHKRSNNDDWTKLTRDLVAHTPNNHPYLLDPNETIIALRDEITFLEGVVDSLKR